MKSQLPPGAELGPYELLLPLPRTGAAQVYIARFHGASGFRTRVALKTIPRSYLDDVPTEHLLREQAALAAQIRHSNLVEALDLGEHADTLYVAMEWVDGEPLQALLAEAVNVRSLPIALAVNIAGQLCRGLHAIHEFRDARGMPAGAVHGHVSPQNLVLAYNGTVKLCDFGIARAMDRISFLTRANQQYNKLTFIAPEQLSAKPVDQRSDVFSVGTLLYMLTTSRHPFEGNDVRETLDNICSTEQAPLPGTMRAGYPDELGAVIAKALRKAPDERWNTALDFYHALERAMPDCFHATSEQRLADYLERVFAARKLALHARIHAAELQLDKQRSSVPAPRPSLHSSIRAVAFDATPEEGANSRDDNPLSRSAALGRLRAGLGRAQPFGVAIALMSAVTLGFWWELRPGEDTTPSSALASQGVSVDALNAPPLAPAPTLDPAPLAPTSSALAPIDVSDLPPEVTPIPGTTASHTSEPAAHRGPTPPKKPARAALAVPADARARAAATAAAAAYPYPTPTSAPAPASASAPPPAPATPRPTPINAWDPSTFGGRH